MNFNLTQKITVGFAALVLSIIIVGGGGLVGNSNIYQRLNNVTEQTLPILVGSFNQMIELQQANQALYNTLSVTDSAEIDKNTKEFLKGLDSFDQKIKQLAPKLTDNPDLQKQLAQITKLSQTYRKEARQVLALHNTRLNLNKQVSEQEIDLRMKADSLSSWVQRYISSSKNSDGVIGARNMTRSLSKLRIQLTTFKRTSNLKTLNERVSSLKGDLVKQFEGFKKADNKAKQISSLVPPINKHFFLPEGLLDLYNQQKQNQDALNAQLATTRNLLNQVTTAANGFIKYAKTEASAAQEKAEQAHGLSRNLIIMLATVTTVMAIVIAYITVGAIRKPLAQFSRQLKLLRDGDLTVKFNQERKDEFGQLADSLNTVVTSQRQILQNVSDGSNDLTDVAEKNAAISQMTTGAMQSQSEKLELASSAAVEMESSVTEVANHSATTLDAVHQCEELSHEVNRNVENTLSSIKEQASAINNAVEVSNGLASYSSEIDAILETIHAIAEQTNLLALNAAIEAARAGDHGRGFAVVADEVRGLASRTRNSTDEIQQMIENMKGSIQEVVTVMQHSFDQAQSCVGHANTSQESLASMNNSISNIRSLNTQIEDAAQQQMYAVKEVSDQLTRINDAASETAEGAQNASSYSDRILDVSKEQLTLLKKFTL